MRIDPMSDDQIAGVDDFYDASPKDLQFYYDEAKRRGLHLVSEDEFLTRYKVPALLNVIRERMWFRLQQEKMGGPVFKFASTLKSCGVGFEWVVDFVDRGKYEWVAFLFTPPMGVDDRVRFNLSKGIASLNRVLDKDVVDETGTVDWAGAKTVLEVTKYLDERTYGKAIQRTHNVNEDNAPKSIGDIEKNQIGYEKLREIDEKIAELEGRKKLPAKKVQDSYE